MAIKIASNFETGASEPLDKRQVVSVYADLASITTAYEGLEVWVISEHTKYRYVQNEWVKCNDNKIVSNNTIQSVVATDNNIQCGHYPDTSEENAAFLLGNGTSNQPNNAMVVDWNGNLKTSGNITDGMGNTLAQKATLADILVDGKVILWNATTQKLETATTEQLTELLLWVGTETELRELKENDGLEEGKLYATYDNVEFE